MSQNQADFKFKPRRKWGKKGPMGVRYNCNESIGVMVLVVSELILIWETQT